VTNSSDKWNPNNVWDVITILRACPTPQFFQMVPPSVVNVVTHGDENPQDVAREEEAQQ
jgi:hypothetical protein